MALKILEGLFLLIGILTTFLIIHHREAQHTKKLELARKRKALRQRIGLDCLIEIESDYLSEIEQTELNKQT